MRINTVEAMPKKIWMEKLQVHKNPQRQESHKLFSFLHVRVADALRNEDLPSIKQIFGAGLLI